MSGQATTHKERALLERGSVRQLVVKKAGDYISQWLCSRSDRLVLSGRLLPSCKSGAGDVQM